MSSTAALFRGPGLPLSVLRPGTLVLDQPFLLLGRLFRCLLVAAADFLRRQFRRLTIKQVGNRNDLQAKDG